MDVQRGKEVRRNRIVKRIVILVVVIAAVSAAGLAVMRMQPAIPTVERGAIWPDTVKRGSMLREVHGIGTHIDFDDAAIRNSGDEEHLFRHQRPDAMDFA